MAIKTQIDRAPVKGVYEYAALIFATGLGSGYSPIAPGTAGTVVGAAVYLLLVGYWQVSLIVYISVVTIIFILGCITAHRVGQHFGVADAKQIVIDEVVGYLITMAAVPPKWFAVLLGFILFRVFDVIKPWPASYFDRCVANGFGVVMDDVAAGLYALVILQLLNYFKLLN